MNGRFAILSGSSAAERWLLRFATPPWLVAAFLAVVAPVVSVGFLGHRQLHGSLTAMAFERRQSLAHLSALALESRLDNLVDVGLALAGRTQLRDHIAAGDWEGAIQNLERVPLDLPYIERIFLADPGGTLRADWPALPDARGENFAHRDWYLGVSEGWRPYVSETYLRAAPPQLRVVAAAVPVFASAAENGTDAGRPIGVMVLQVRVETLLDWSSEVSHGPSGFVYFIDQRGRVVAHPKSSGEDGADLGHVLAVQRVLRGERGVLETPCPFGDEPTLAAFEPVRAHGWGVVTQQPVREAFRGREEALADHRRRYGLVILFASLLGGLVVAVLAALRRYAIQIGDIYHLAPCGYHSLDAEGVFRRINQTELDWLGYEPEEILGRMRFPDLLTAEGVARFRENYPRFMAEGAIAGLEFDLVRKDGSILPVLLSATAVTDKHGAFVMSRSTLFEISDLKSARNALEAANSELEAFSYSVSHDLRSPLRAIDGFSLALAEDSAGKLAPEELGHLARIRAATQRMGTLIDDLLDLSRVSRATMKRVPVDISGTARRILVDLAAQDTDRRVETVVEEGLVAEGDANLLELALRNLLENAWKFSSRREQARIEFGAGEPDPGCGGPEFFVRDNGVGFDMKYAGKLFGAFQRLHGASEFPGTGVGLATVQRILHRHGGWIRAEAAPDQGACFRFCVGAPFSPTVPPPP